MYRCCWPTVLRIAVQVSWYRCLAGPALWPGTCDRLALQQGLHPRSDRVPAGFEGLGVHRQESSGCLGSFSFTGFRVCDSATEQAQFHQGIYLSRGSAGWGGLPMCVRKHLQLTRKPTSLPARPAGHLAVPFKHCVFQSDKRASTPVLSNTGSKDEVVPMCMGTATANKAKRVHMHAFRNLRMSEHSVYHCTYMSAQT